MTDDQAASGAVPWQAGPADAAVVARMLHDFNTEFATPSPGPEVLSARLTVLLAGEDVVALLVGEPPVGLGVVSFRPNVWYDGPGSDSRRAVRPAGTAGSSTG